MNKLLSIILMSIVIFTSCQQEKSEEESKPSTEITSTFDSTSLKTTAIETPEEQSFLFRYKFSPEESFKYRLTTITNTEQTIVADSSMSEGMNQKLIFIIDFHFGLSVINIYSISLMNYYIVGLYFLYLIFI